MYDFGELYDSDAFNDSLSGFYFEIIPGKSSQYQESISPSHHHDASANTENPPQDTYIDELIITGRRLASEMELARAIAKYTPSRTDDLVFSIGKLLFDDAQHRYVVLDQVGDTACDTDEAWTALKNYAAPGQTGTVTEGSHSNLPLFGPVTHHVDEATMTVTNVAEPGHLFYPGSVTRKVVVSEGKVYIQTTGVGNGQFAGINVLGSQALWSQLDAKIARYVDANDNGPGDC